MRKVKAYHTHWRTKDGRMLLPEEMETGHIVNALNMLIRTVQQFHLIKWRETTKAALRVGAYASSPATPDGAQMAAEEEFCQLMATAEAWSNDAYNVEQLRQVAFKTFPVSRRMEEIVLKRRAAGLPDRGLLEVKEVRQ